MESKQIELEDRTEWRNERGQFHRLDGSAIEYSDGHKEWWVNGLYYSENEFHQEVIKLKLNRLINR